MKPEPLMQDFSFMDRDRARRQRAAVRSGLMWVVVIWFVVAALLGTFVLGCLVADFVHQFL